MEGAGLCECLWVFDAVDDFDEDSFATEIDSFVVVCDYSLLHVEERERHDITVQFISRDDLGGSAC